MQRLALLSPAASRYLRVFASRWRWLLALRAAGWAAAAFVAWALVSCLLDRAFRFPPGLRIALLAAGTAGAAAMLLIPLRRLLRPIDWVALTELIESQNPRFEQRLVTVTSRVLGDAECRGSDEILAHLVHELDRQVAAEPTGGLLPLRGVVVPWLATAAVIAVAGLLLVGAPNLGMRQLLRRYATPTANVAPVTTTHLTVLAPANSDVDPANPVRVEVVADHLGGSPVWLHLSSGDNTGSSGPGAVAPPRWSRTAMDGADGHYALALTTLDRDLHYYVTAGDATTPQYMLRVKRPPAVAQFRIRYTYPAYTGWAPFTTTNNTGVIEAPAGSEAQITIIATEPLAAATLTLGGSAIAMDAGERPEVRQAKLLVQRSGPYLLDLLSARQVHGNGPEHARIIATADRPPVVRLQQGNQTLRLSPREMVPLSYQAMDDFSLAAIRVRARVNGNGPFELDGSGDALDQPVQLVGDRRHQEDVVNFDLARLKLAMGDVVSAVVEGRDRADHITLSDPLQIVISPRSIDLDWQARIDELSGASQLAAMYVAELEAARSAMNERAASRATQPAGDVPDVSPAALAGASANRHLSGASEMAALVRQSLLRAIVHSQSAELSVALAGCVDAAQWQSDAAAELFRVAGTSSVATVRRTNRSERVPLESIMTQARHLAHELQIIARGERAAALIADRDNLRASKARPAPSDPRAMERRNQGIARADEDISAGMIEIGLDPKSAGLEGKLDECVRAEADLLRAAAPIDFAEAAREWNARLPKDAHVPSDFGARLAAAAQAEAVRPDADLVWSHDLELASRAAGTLEAQAAEHAPGDSPISNAIPDFAQAMATLQQAHELNRKPAGSRSASEITQVRTDAATARQQISRWAAAGGDDGQQRIASNFGSGANANARANAAEELALRAGFESANRNYAGVRELDKTLIRQLTDAVRAPATQRAIAKDLAANKPTDLPPEQQGPVPQRLGERIQRIQRAGRSIAQSMATAESVDRLAQDQQDLQQEADSLGPDPGQLLGRQQSVADAIDRIEQARQGDATPSVAQPQPPPAPGSPADDDWRARATQALLNVQETLSALPSQLGALQLSIAARRDAEARAATARDEADEAPPPHRDEANRAAMQAQQDADDAADRLDRALAPLLPQVASNLAAQLEPFAPEAGGAQDAVSRALLPALEALNAGARRGNARAVDQASAEVRNAIELSQQELARAQDTFMQRDPLTAAKWYARAAADSLARAPADLKTALARQANVTLALSRAWDSSVHRAAAQRLQILPSLQQVYAASAAPADRPPTVAPPTSPNFSGTRDLAGNRPTPRDPEDVGSSMPEPDPPGYEEPLRLYFEAIGKMQHRQQGDAK